MSIRNDKVLAAIAAAATSATEQSKYDLYRELLASTLLVAIDGEVNNARETAPLLRLGNARGQAAVLAFTDSDALAKWRPGWPVIAMVPRTLFANLIALPVHCVVINIGGPIDSLVEREVFGMLANNVVPIARPAEIIERPAGSKSYYRAAEGPRAAAISEPIRVALQSTSNVEMAYLMDRLLDGDPKPSLVLALHFHEDAKLTEKQAQMRRLGALPEKYLPSDESLWIMEASDAMLSQIGATIEPLFRRGQRDGCNSFDIHPLSGM